MVGKVNIDGDFGFWQVFKENESEMQEKRKKERVSERWKKRSKMWVEN